MVESALVLDAIFYRVPALSILQGAYLKVNPGSICGLIGLNGSGKSTLLNIAAGQSRPSNGLTIIDGERFATPSLKRRFAKIAYLPQQSMLPRHMPVRSVIRAFPKATQALLTHDLLAPHLDKRIADLSGGERRYLELKLTLSLDRTYYLLDEPFTGIEPLIIDHMVEDIKAVASKGKGVLATDHYHQYLLPLIDDAYLMQNKQCYPLNASTDFYTQLQDYGYFSMREEKGLSS